MKRLCWALGFLSVSAIAQQPPLPAATPADTNTPRMFISATEIASRIAQADAAAKAGTRYDGGPMLVAGPFRAGLEYHAGPAGNVGLHENDGELFVVLEGSGTMTLGGTLVNPTHNGTNQNAASATGGTAYKLVKGDMIMIPVNTPHSVTQTDGKLVMLSLHLPYPSGASAPAVAAAH